MFDEFVFGKDLRIVSDHLTVAEGHDHWSPHDEVAIYHDMPLSFMCDFYDGAAFAKQLLAKFPGKRRFLDLGTATGCVPLTMRWAGMLALGVDGIDVGKTGKLKAEMLRYDFQRELFAWHKAPEIVDCVDITYPFGIYNQKGEIQKFDFIFSSDCFEHLVTERIPELVDNVWAHLDDDGYGIFEVNTGSFYDMHLTQKPLEWWEEMFGRRFTMRHDLSEMDFTYTRSFVGDGEIRYVEEGKIDGFKILFWAQKKT